MFPVPAFAVHPDSNRFMAVNSAMEGHPLFDTPQLVETSVEDLTDQSLYKCLTDLLATCKSNPNSKHSNMIPSHGSENYEITAKAVIDGKKPAYILFTVMQIIEEEEVE